MDKFEGEKARNIEETRASKVLPELYAERRKLPEIIQQLDSKLDRLKDAVKYAEEKIKKIHAYREEQGGKRLVNTEMRAADDKTLEDLRYDKDVLEEDTERVKSQLYGLLEEDEKLAKQYLDYKRKMALFQPENLQAN